MRHLAVLLALLALSVVGAASAFAQPGATGARELRSYLGKMAPQIRDYRTMLIRADRGFANVSNQVAIERLERSRRDFRRLATRIAGVKAPSPLRRQHRNLVTAIETVSKAFASFASARRQFARDKKVSGLLDRNTKARTGLKRAEGLQFGWGQSVRARAARLHVAIPAWLREFVPGS